MVELTKKEVLTLKEMRELLGVKDPRTVQKFLDDNDIKIIPISPKKRVVMTEDLLAAMRRAAV
jgi:predicted CoA-binding protein